LHTFTSIIFKHPTYSAPNDSQRYSVFVMRTAHLRQGFPTVNPQPQSNYSKPHLKIAYTKGAHKAIPFARKYEADLFF